jgi:hypothetical protein
VATGDTGEATIRVHRRVGVTSRLRMVFTSPIWLVALLPWAGLFAWMLRGRSPRVDVPFLALWRGPAGDARRRRTTRLPPAPVLAALLATLLAIFAAAGPGVRIGKFGAVAILIDRGADMSASAAADELLKDFGDGPLDVYTVPAEMASDGKSFDAGGAGKPLEPDDDGKAVEANAGGKAVDQVSDTSSDGSADTTFVGEFKRSTWLQAARQLPRTGADTGQALPDAIASLRRRTNQPILVITDQPFPAPGVAISPDTPIGGVGIERFSARSNPQSQAMLTLINRSAAGAARVTLTTGGRVTTRLLQLPPPGDRRNYFVNLDSIGPTIQASVDVAGASTPALSFVAANPDASAYLVRQPLWPAVAAGGSLPAQLTRMIRTYAAERPASVDSRSVTIVAGFDHLANLDAAGAAVVGDEVLKPIIQTPIVSGEYANLTAGVDWPAAARGGAVATSPAPLPAGWTTLVSAGGDVLVAARAKPVRQAWVSFRSPTWSRSTDFVIFWAKVFDWLGDANVDVGRDALVAPGAGVSDDSSVGASEYSADVVGNLDRDWLPETSPPGVDAHQWPGFFRRSDGAVRAANGAPLEANLPRQIPATSPTGTATQSATRTIADWQAAIRRLSLSAAPTIPLAPALAIAAIFCLAFAALTWRGA